MRRLDKQESRQRWAELRDLWNQYDPIGVMGEPHSPLDEYESYVGWTMRCLESDASADEIVAGMEEIVSGHMGMPHFNRDKATEFAKKFIDWYREKWADTRV